MARQVIVPEYGQVQEDSEREWVLPEYGQVMDTTAAASGSGVVPNAGMRLSPKRPMLLGG